MQCDKFVLAVGQIIGHCIYGQMYRLTEYWKANNFYTTISDIIGGVMRSSKT